MLDNIAKSPFHGCHSSPECFRDNRESILFKKLRAPGFPPSPTVGALSTGMTTQNTQNICYVKKSATLLHYIALLSYITPYLRRIAKSPSYISKYRRWIRFFRNFRIFIHMNPVPEQYRHIVCLYFYCRRRHLIYIIR